MSNSYNVIRRMMRTEKGTEAEPIGKYIFIVDSRANKIDVKAAVEEIYKVKVKDVNTMVVSGKLKRVRFEQGKTPDWKKAIVTLKKGEKIQLA